MASSTSKAPLITLDEAWTVPGLGTVLGKRWHLVELHDLDAFPVAWRNFVTDVLAFGWTLDPAKLMPTRQAAHAFREVTARWTTLRPPAAVVAAILDDALRRARQTTVVDLCSGASGPIVSLSDELGRLRRATSLANGRGNGNGNGSAASKAGAGTDESIRFVLTDLHPNLPAFAHAARARPTITYERNPVDALACTLSGFRTLFGSFHHFRPAEARAILQDAVETGNGIGVFEFTARTPGMIAFIVVATIVISLVAAPFMRPFSLRRLFYTYIIPVIPFVLCLDGFVSCLRTYSTDETVALIRSLDHAESFRWTVGSRQIVLPWVHLRYIVGVPVTTAAM